MAVVAYTLVDTYRGHSDLAVAVVAPVEDCILVVETLEDIPDQVAVDMAVGLGHQAFEMNQVHHLMSIQMDRSTVRKYGQRYFLLVPTILQCHKQ